MVVNAMGAGMHGPHLPLRLGSCRAQEPLRVAPGKLSGSPLPANLQTSVSQCGNCQGPPVPADLTGDNSPALGIGRSPEVGVSHSLSCYA